MSPVVEAAAEKWAGRADSLLAGAIRVIEIAERLEEYFPFSLLLSTLSGPLVEQLKAKILHSCLDHSWGEIPNFLHRDKPLAFDRNLS